MYSEIEHYVVTIITESVLEAKITKSLDKLGAHGYTITDARGKGDHGSSDWGKNKNIRIEIVCCINVSEAIIKNIQSNYFKDYGIIAFKHKVEVARKDKF